MWILKVQYTLLARNLIKKRFNGQTILTFRMFQRGLFVNIRPSGASTGALELGNFKTWLKVVISAWTIDPFGRMSWRTCCSFHSLFSLSVCWIFIHFFPHWETCIPSPSSSPPSSSPRSSSRHNPVLWIWSGPHHRSHLSIQPSRKTPLDFTKQVNRWREEGEDEKWMSVCFPEMPLWKCDLSQASWTCSYLIRWIVATEAEYSSFSAILYLSTVWGVLSPD